MGFLTGREGAMFALEKHNWVSRGVTSITNNNFRSFYMAFMGCRRKRGRREVIFAKILHRSFIVFDYHANCNILLSNKIVVTRGKRAN